MSVLRALNHRNYRLYFIGQGLSLMGTWMQIMAMSWLVYRLTASPYNLMATKPIRYGFWALWRASYTMSFMGMAPFGSLLSGSLASHIGTPETVLLGGIICITSGAVFAVKLKYLRPYFQQAFHRHETAAEQGR